MIAQLTATRVDSNRKRNSNIVKKESLSMDVAAARNVQKDSGIQTPPYIPVNNVMEAIEGLQKFFEINESVDEIFNSSSYLQLVKQSRYNTTMNFKFPELNDIFSLNNMTTLRSIVNISSSNILFCSSGNVPFNLTAFDAGDLFVMSEEWLKFSDNSISETEFGKYARATNMSRNQGFAFLRKVINVTEVNIPSSYLQMYHLEGPCADVITMDILPIEIFDSFELKSNVSQPFRESYFPLPVPINMSYTGNLTHGRNLQGGCASEGITFDDFLWVPVGVCAE